MGSGGMGQRKRHSSVKGRTRRERNYLLEHPVCEWLEFMSVMDVATLVRCYAEATDVDHTEGRGLGGWNRDNSPLKAFCWRHHRLYKHLRGLQSGLHGLQ